MAAAEEKAEAKDIEMTPTETAKEPEKEPEKTKEPEKPKEQELDALPETRPKVHAGAVDINTQDATLNVMPTSNNRVLMTLTEGGFQYLLAGVRTTAGLKSGRYMIEVKILETHTGKGEPGGAASRIQTPRTLVRLGLANEHTSLLIGDGSPGHVCFDSDGFYIHEKNKKRVSQKFGRDTTVALLINLEEGSPNANTISLFRDGTRISEPQPIPEALRGKPLYPAITYKNVTLQVNLGPTRLRPLPFTCHMLSEAAQDDVELAPVQNVNGDQCEVVLPVGLPDTGFFDWVDTFIEKHPNYVELSDRKILEWAVKSGMFRPKGLNQSNDKPDLKFGFPLMDDMSVQRLLSHLAPTTKRNFVVAELTNNLLENKRKEVLSRFCLPGFTKKATVVVGEPPAEFKAKVQELILNEKKAKAELERKRKALEEERKRKLEEKRKSALLAKKKREGEEEEKEDEPGPEAPMEEEVVVELTEEEKAMTHRKTACTDVTETLLSKLYSQFTLPSKEEGFDEVSFEWSTEDAAATKLKDWIFAKKLTQRVEDLKPGESFKEAWTAWQKTIVEWKKQQAEWKDVNKRKAMIQKRKEAKKKEAEEKGDEEGAKQAMEDVKIDFDELEVSTVENVRDIGDGRPLFSDFVYEDWALIALRYELHLLLNHFKKDLNDPDRPSFAEKDLGFYYHLYFKKSFSLRSYTVDKVAALAEMIKDVFRLNEKTGFLESLLEEGTAPETFVKLTEEHRRERQRRLDAGDETAELKFPHTAPQAAPPRHAPQQPGVRTAAHGAHGGSIRPVERPLVVGARGPQQPSQMPPVRGTATLQQGQKRAYTPPPMSNYISKAPRTTTYGSYAGGSGSGYRR